MTESSIRLTVVVENTAPTRGLLGEHGLSVLVECGGGRYLWDAGQGLSIQHNCAQLGIHRNSIDAICLSHGHYDHAGGLLAAADWFGPVPVYVHPAAVMPRYRGPRDDLRFIGVPWWPEDLTRAGVRLFPSAGPVCLGEGIMLTGPIPNRQTRNVGTEFWSQGPDGLVRDEFVDDQALVLETDTGLVVLLGCSHAGVVETVAHAGEMLGRRVRAVVGGMHLIHAADQVLADVVVGLAGLGVEEVFPCHCTGLKATAALVTELGGGECHVGTVLEF